MHTGQQRGFLMFSVVGLAIASGHADGQIIDVDIAQPTLAPGDSTLITLSVSYPAGDYAVAGIATDIVVSEIQGGLSDLAVLAPMDGPGTSVGVLSPDGITGIVAGQLNFPPAMIFADDSNPIAFYSFEFTRSDFISDPVLLDFETSTSRFDVYIDRDSLRSESRLDDLVEGSARIIIPAPMGAVVLGMGALVIGRRRRL